MRPLWMRKTIFTAGVGFAAILLIVGLMTYLLPDGRKYCRLRFGTPVAHEVILACDSRSIRLFRTGSLLATPERYPLVSGRLPKEVSIPPIRTDGGKSYKINSISEDTDSGRDHRHSLMLNVSVEGDATFNQYCDVALVGKLDGCKLAHFDGPLSIGPVTVTWVPVPMEFVIGGVPADVRATVGTLDKDRGCWTVVESDNDRFNEGGRPTVTIEFPTKQPGGSIVHTYPLDEYCCGAIFKGPVTVPDGVSVGTAKATFAFDAWRERVVAATMIDVPVVTPEAASTAKQ
jgi:hypothetical protein